MDYFVISNDGSKFGPATLEMLNKWAAEGRVLADTIIERASDGVRGPASLLPGLVLPQSATPSPAVPPTEGQPDVAQPPMFKEPATPPAGESPYGPAMAPPESGAFLGYPRQQQQYRRDVVPPELCGKFNWGAFLLSWIWGLNHKAYITLLTLGLNILSFGVGFAMSPLRQAGQTPSPGATAGVGVINIVFGLVGLGLIIWYGIKGYEWAWLSGRFATPEECKKCQAIWGWWGLGIVLTVCVCYIVMIVVAAAALVGTGAAAGGRGM